MGTGNVIHFFCEDQIGPRDVIQLFERMMGSMVVVLIAQARQRRAGLVDVHFVQMSLPRASALHGITGPSIHWGDGEASEYMLGE
jgi:hypothetical protein